MEIKLNGKGQDEGRTLILEERLPTKEEEKKAEEAWESYKKASRKPSSGGVNPTPQIVLGAKYIVRVGGESIQVDGDELCRAVIALCPEEANLVM